MQRIRIPTALVAFALCAGSVWAQRMPSPLSHPEALKLLSEPGRWIDTDGSLQPDGTYQAKEIQIVAAGDVAQTDAPAISGPVQGLNRAKSTFTVLGYSVTWDGKTTIKDENKRVILSSKLERIRASGAEVVAAANPGCLLQIAAGAARAGLSIRAVHPIELLDEATRDG